MHQKYQKTLLKKELKIIIKTTDELVKIIKKSKKKNIKKN